MPTSFDLDLTAEGIDPDKVDTGGTVSVPGWYRCRLHDVAERDGGGDTVFELHVTHGPWTGSKIWVHLHDADSADNRATALTRAMAYAKRLGLISEAELKAKRAAFDFISAIGREVFVRLTKQTNKNTRIEGVWPEYIPFYPLTDDRVPADVRKACGVPVSDSKAAAAAAVETNGNGGATGASTATGAGTTTAAAPTRVTNAAFNDL